MNPERNQTLRLFMYLGIPLFRQEFAGDMVGWFTLCFNDGNITADICIQGGTKKHLKHESAVYHEGKCFCLDWFW